MTTHDDHKQSDVRNNARGLRVAIRNVPVSVITHTGIMRNLLSNGTRPLSFTPSSFSTSRGQTIRIESAPACPCCGAVGEVFLADCYDPDGTTLGNWRHRKCKDCSSLWLDPRPAVDSIPHLYGSRYFTHSSSVDSRRRTLFHRIRQSAKASVLRDLYCYPLREQDKLAPGVVLGRILARLPSASRNWGRSVRFVRRDEGLLLDVGCGNGEFLLKMRAHGWRVFGLEPDPAAAAVARAADLHVLGSNIEDAELQPNSISVITLHHVIEHLTDFPRAIKSLAGALAPGGVMVSISPNPEGALAKTFRQHWRALDTPRHLQLPTRSAVTWQFESAGLTSEAWTTRLIAKHARKQSLALMRQHVSPFGHDQAMKRIISLCSRLPFVAGEEIVAIGKKPTANGL